MRATLEGRRGRQVRCFAPLGWCPHQWHAPGTAASSEERRRRAEISGRFCLPQPETFPLPWQTCCHRLLPRKARGHLSIRRPLRSVMSHAQDELPEPGGLGTAPRCSLEMPRQGAGAVAVLTEHGTCQVLPGSESTAASTEAPARQQRRGAGQDLSPLPPSLHPPARNRAGCCHGCCF